MSNNPTDCPHDFLGVHYKRAERAYKIHEPYPAQCVICEDTIDLTDLPGYLDLSHEHQQGEDT